MFPREFLISQHHAKIKEALNLLISLKMQEIFKQEIRNQ